MRNTETLLATIPLKGGDDPRGLMPPRKMLVDIVEVHSGNGHNSLEIRETSPPPGRTALEIQIVFEDEMSVRVFSPGKKPGSGGSMHLTVPDEVLGF